LTLAPVMVDGIGTVDMSMQGIGCNITCVPTGIDQLDFDSFFDALNAGADLTVEALDISTTTVGGLNFDAAAVQITELQRNFSAADNRLGTLTMSAKRTFTTGAQNALFTIAAVV